MTTTAINAVGFCAHYSPQGDWAFEFALRLAWKKDVQLNIFHFLKDPYDPESADPDEMSREERARFLIEREKELRFYYDERLGDYLKAGFRVCEENERKELHQCLCNREFQVLVLAYPDLGVRFGGKPIEAFANAFVCPLVLVGPGSPDEYRLNRPAALLAETLGISGVGAFEEEPSGLTQVTMSGDVARLNPER